MNSSEMYKGSQQLNMWRVSSMEIIRKESGVFDKSWSDYRNNLEFFTEYPTNKKYIGVALLL